MWGLGLAAVHAAAAPAPPPRPPEFTRPEAETPLPLPRPVEFSEEKETIFPSWRPLKLVRLARMTPQDGLRLTDAPGLVLQFAAPNSQASASLQELAACERLFAGKKAIATRLAPITGANGCGIAAPVSLQGLVMPDNRSIRFDPPPVMRCDMAASAVDWSIGAIPSIESQGGRVKLIVDAGGYQCRNRNNAIDGKISEHALGDAIDLIGVRFEDGRMLKFSALDNEMTVAQALRETACARFATVLGPGSDGMHENHIHVDLEARRHGGKLCEWNLR